MCLAIFGCTTVALLGLWSRVSVPAAAACALYLVYWVGHAQGKGAYTHHHTTLLAWALVWTCFTPCGRSYSIDRWLAVRKAEREGKPAPEERGNLYGLRLIALQVSAVYFWTALAKSEHVFLSGQRLAQYVMKFYTGSTILDEGALGVAFRIAAVLTVFLEFSLAFGLLFKATRRWLVIPGLVLHGLFYMVLDVNTFTATMWILYLALYEADDVHGVIDRLEGKTVSGAG
jgi:hypothetical protein